MKTPHVICIIMGGGRGERLYPLTKLRCKPAVPLAGQFRLIDIPISNCIHSGYNKIYVLTQFNTASLHRHIFETFKFDPFSGGFVEVLAAEQNSFDAQWYQGTTDAVRQNLHHFRMAHQEDDLLLILSGDQLYRMDFKEIIQHHLETQADVTIATKPVLQKQASHLGIMRIHPDYQISHFVEKPKDPTILSSFTIPQPIQKQLSLDASSDYCLASMGIYVFKSKILKEVLKDKAQDFGKEVIPSLIHQKRVCAHIFDGYWEDIGTVRAFFEANLMLTEAVPAFNFFDNQHPIFTRPRYLPASKINFCQAEKTIIADGCILSDVYLKRCIVGIRSYIGEHTHLENVIMMGADHFNTLQDFREPYNPQHPHLGIGNHCHIENAIIDKNARIGNHVRLSPKNKPDGFEQGDIYVRDGILIVGKDGVVPDGTILD